MVENYKKEKKRGKREKNTWNKKRKEYNLYKEHSKSYIFINS